MIYYTKCRLINESNRFLSIRFFDSNESWSPVDFCQRENQLLLKKKKKEKEEKFPPRSFTPDSFLFAFLIAVKQNAGSHQLSFLILRNSRLVSISGTTVRKTQQFRKFETIVITIIPTRFVHSSIRETIPSNFSNSQSRTPSRHTSDRILAANSRANAQKP